MGNYDDGGVATAFIVVLDESGLPVLEGPISSGDAGSFPAAVAISPNAEIYVAGTFRVGGSPTPSSRAWAARRAPGICTSSTRTGGARTVTLEPAKGADYVLLGVAATPAGTLAVTGYARSVGGGVRGWVGVCPADDRFFWVDQGWADAGYSNGEDVAVSVAATVEHPSDRVRVRAYAP